MNWDDYFAQIERAFDTYPPESGRWEHREAAFLALDRVFQDPELTGPGGALDLAADEGPIERLFERRLRRGVMHLLTPGADEGIFVIPFYNMGYIVSVNGFRVGFDLKYPSRNDPYSFGWDAEPDLEAALAGAVDALFISHAHADHADADIYGRVLEAGRPLVTPDTIAGAGPTHVRLTDTVEFQLDVPAAARDLRVRAHRSPHVYDSDDGIAHFCFEVTFPGGFTLYHGGDLDYIRATPWSGTFLDLLVLKAGGVSPEYDDANPDDRGDDEDAFRAGADSFRSGHILTGHIAELGHPVGGGRERFGTALACARAAAAPAAVLFWGERWRIG